MKEILLIGLMLLLSINLVYALAPIVSDIPNFNGLLEDTPFTTGWKLDGYAIDPEGDTITWGVSGDTNTNIIINAGNTITINPVANWYGKETVTFTACDPGMLCASDVADVVIKSANDAPVVSDILDVSFNEDSSTTIDLNGDVDDVDDTDARLTWTTSGNSNININIINGIATFTATVNWNSFEIITFRATDPDGLFDEDLVTVTVNPMGESPPVISGIPNINGLSEDTPPFTTSWKLDSYVSDPDNLDSQISWSVSGSVNSGVTINPDNTITINPVANWHGRETVTFTACDHGDPVPLCVSDVADVVIKSVNDVPVLGDIPNFNGLLEDTPVTTGWKLNGYISDVDNADSQMTWSVSGNDNINVVVNPDKTISFSAPANWYGKETVTFTACDPGMLCASDVADVVINSVNDIPVANAGPDQTNTPGNLITLDGSASSDIENDPLTYSWSQVSGPAVTLSDNTAINPTFTPTADGVYEFQLIVNDGSSSVGDSVLITISTPPSGGGGGGGGGGGSNHEYTNIATPITPVTAPVAPTVTPAPATAPATTVTPTAPTAPLTTGAAVVNLVKENPVSAGIVALLVLAVIIGAIYYFKKK